LMHGSGDALVVTGSLTDPSGDVYLVVDASQTRLIAEVEVFIDGESGRLHLWPTAPGDIGPGSHHGKITVKACSDAGCTRQYPGSPKTLDIAYTITAPPFNIDNLQLDFTSYVGATALPAPQTVNVTSDIWVGSWAHSYVSSGEWLGLDYQWEGESGRAIFTVERALPVGEYHLPVKLGLGGIGYHHTVNVTYRVLENPIQLSATSLQFDLDTSSETSDLQQTITVANASGADEFGWTASVNVPWLTLSRTAGDTALGHQLVLHVNNAVANLSPGEHHALVTITDAEGARGGNQFNVTLSLDLPVVQGVFPYIAYPEQAQEVVVVGDGFTPASEIMVGDHQIENIEYLSPNRVKIVVPAMPKGVYPVFVQSPLGAKISESRVVVVDHAQYETVEFDFEDQFHFIHDEERKSLYAYNAYTQYRAGVVIAKRYRDGVRSEQSVTALDGNPILIMEMTPDGRYLVVLGSSGRMDVINLDAFMVTASYTSAPHHWFETQALAFYTNRKAAIAADMIRVMDLAGNFEEAAFLGDYQSGYSRIASIPALGSLALNHSYDAYPYMAVHNLDDGSTVSIPDLQCTGFNRAGDKCHFRQQVYQWNKEGYIPLGTVTSTPAFMPHGDQVVIYDSENLVLKRYDLQHVDGNEFAETGTSIPFDPSPPYGHVHSVTLDGRYVFVRLENRLAIVPLTGN